MVGTVVGAIIVLWFALANSQRVTVDYLLGSSEIRLVFVIVGSALAGGLITALAGWRRQRRSRT
jgi:uncharacterized integral membrane protein